MSADSGAWGPRGRNREKLVGWPVLSELQEAWEFGARILFMGKKNMKSIANKNIGGNEEDKEMLSTLKSSGI